MIGIAAFFRSCFQVCVHGFCTKSSPFYTQETASLLHILSFCYSKLLYGKNYESSVGFAVRVPESRGRGQGVLTRGFRVQGRGRGEKKSSGSESGSALRGFSGFGV